MRVSGAHHTGSVGVRGSSPLCSTTASVIVTIADFLCNCCSKKEAVSIYKTRAELKTLLGIFNVALSIVTINC